MPGQIIQQHVTINSGVPAPKDQAIEILKHAHEIGYEFFDTAQCYTGVRHKGDHLKLDSSPETIYASLKKLQTDYIDIYYQHRIDP